MRRVLKLLVPAVVGLTACVDVTGKRSDAEATPWSWEPIVQADERGMLMSVWGAQGEDAWVVGGSLTGGGVAFRLSPDGGLADVPLPDNTAMLTWVHGRGVDDVWVSGLYGTLLHWDGSSWTDRSLDVVEAFWGVHAGPDGTVVAVGGPFRQVGSAPVLARGDAASGLVLVDLPSDLTDFSENLFKVHHDGVDRFCAVGAAGVALSLGTSGPATSMPTGTAMDLVTVEGSGRDLVAVGGRGTGGVFELDGQGTGWSLAAEAPAGVSGVSLLEDGRAIVVGENGFAALWDRPSGDLVVSEPVTIDLLHAVWVDAEEDVAWAVGGNWFGSDYTGTLLRGSP